MEKCSKPPIRFINGSFTYRRGSSINGYDRLPKDSLRRLWGIGKYIYIYIINDNNDNHDNHDNNHNNIIIIS